MTDNKSKAKTTKRITIRLDEQTEKKLNELIEKTDLTASEVIRNLIINNSTINITQTKKCDNSFLVYHINKFANNINQIAKNLNIANKQNALNNINYKSLLAELQNISYNIKKLL